MSQTKTKRHRCYRCIPHDVQGPFRHNGEGEGSELESVDTTFTDDFSEVFFASGYSAREIAIRQAQDTIGRVYVNNISRKIKRHDLSVPVFYTVAKAPVYTLCAPDEHHEKVYRRYWPPLEENG